MSSGSGMAEAVASDALVERTLAFRSMGGVVGLRVASPRGTEHAADRDLRLVAARVQAWASRLTRFDERSELCALNRARTETVSVGPTLGALLGRARELSEMTDGFVDVTLLEARLAAESGEVVGAAGGRWSLERDGRRHLVGRAGTVAFDLDGVGKGWIADRALALLGRYPSAMVDADGDVAMRPGEQHDWAVAIADPRRSDSDLAVIAPPVAAAARSLGIATSGTTVHRWELEHGWAHHLIDPRTGRAADTDVVQATVIAGDASEAEAVAKAIVIAGSEEGLRLLETSAAQAGFVLLDNGQLIAPPAAQEWLS